MKQEHKELIHNKCVRIMAKYPDIFPISKIIHWYWSSRGIVTEEELPAVIRHSISTTIGLNIMVDEVYRSYNTYHYLLKGQAEFTRMENLTVMSILLTYLDPSPSKEDIDAYQNMLSAENLK